MKKFILGLTVCVLGFGLMSCAPSADSLKKVMEDNPEVLFSVIEKHPEKFLEVVNKAAREAQLQARKKEQADEKSQRDEEFKNPKKAEIQEWRAILGPKNAPVTIVEYSDFQCPFCRRGYNTVKEVMKKYEGKVRFVFKHLPLDFHPAAMPAAQIFEAINLQSAEKAYKWHDIVFDNQDKLKAADHGVAWMLKQAGKVGANASKVKAAMNTDKVKDRVKADMQEASKYGFRGTPGYLINGVSLRGAYPAPAFAEIIDRHLKN